MLPHFLSPRERVLYRLKTLSPHSCSELADIISRCNDPHINRSRDEFLVKRREFRMGELIANEEYAAKNIRLALDPHQAKLSSPRQSQQLDRGGIA